MSLPTELEIDCPTVKGLVDTDPELLLLDCREQEEVDLCSIESSMWIPMSELTDRLHELRPHSERQLVVYCHHGVRSLRVAVWLRQQGLSSVQSMAGGIDQWATLVDPNMARY